MISSLRISPAQAFTDSTLTADLNAEDADGDPLARSYVWTVNGEEIEGEIYYYLQSHYFVSGDRVQVTATVSDGIETISRTTETTIQNSPPIIQEFTLSPEEAFTNTDVTAVADTFDADGQPLTTSYSWLVNNEPMEDITGDTLSSEHFVKGDTITVTVEVSDGGQKAFQTNSIIVSDSPGAITATGVPETVQYGQPVSFSLSAEDPDGDDIVFKFNARPNGMQIDEDGNVTWTPTGPMFDTHQDVYWEVDLIQDVPGNPAGSNIRVVDESRQPPLARSGIVFENNLNDALAHGDFDGDGAEELLVTDKNQRLFTIGYNGSDYIQEWMYPYALTGSDGNISSIAAADIDGDDVDEIFVGLTNDEYYSNQADAYTEILIIDGRSGRLRNFIGVNAASIKSIEIADVNNDNNPEIVYLANSDRYSSSAQKLEVRSTSSGFSLLWQSSPLAAQSDLAIGDTDGDGVQEIVLSGGYIFGHNGTNYANEWLFGDGFGNYIRVGDIDGDNISEIIGQSNIGERYLKVFDAVNKSIKTQIEEYFSDVTLTDIDSDGSAEMLALPAYSSEARLYSFDLAGTQQFTTDWTLAIPNSATKAVIADTDGDSQLEFVALSNYRDHIVVASEKPGIEIEWQSDSLYDISGAFTGGEFATFNGKGDRLVFFGSASSYTPTYTSGNRAIQMDPLNGALEWSTPLTGYSGNFDGTLSDLGQDGTIELLFASSRTPSVYSFFSESIIWSAPQMTYSAQKVAKGKINSDQDDDFVILSSSGDVNAYDPKNQVLLWGIDRESGNSLAVADLDGNDKDQVIAGNYKTVTVYLPGDGEATQQFTQSLENIALAIKDADKSVQLANASIQDIVTGDIDNDGKLEVILSATYYSDRSWIVVLNHDLSFRSASEIEGTIQNMIVQDYGSGNRNILLNINDNYYYNSRSQFVEIDSTTGKTVSKSPYMLFMQSQNSMHWVDINGDDVPELSYGTYYSINVTR
ncbi:FG-GAP-like repeat-containing protein [Microbulbifer sp. SA54]|uniref:FG-GAP repeat domain-containing protein n=1 Tax=Microbulbifer sp. SA54 TaxID=3401577 RepID=UPI003AB0BD23